jgi:predicted ATP-binding protein involved in virulence
MAEVREPAFHLTDVTFQNFRRFERLKLDLHPQVTLLVGENGSGKTTVLEGLVALLSVLFPENLLAPWAARPMALSDAHIENVTTNGTSALRPKLPVVVEGHGVVNTARGSEKEWLLTKVTERLKPIWGVQGAIADQYLGVHHDEPDRPALLFLYRGTARLWPGSADQSFAFDELGPRQSGYRDCLTGTSNTELLKSWMRWREQDRLQRFAAALEAGEDPSAVQAPHMEAAEDAVCAVLEGAVRFRYSAATQDLRVHFKDGRILPLSLLSDGQRGLMALAADIAWRAVQLNPAWGREAPKKVEGVVLIDEIDLHLHPRWQRSAVRNLITAFPRLQFVITTHSPQVLGEAQPEWVRVLREDGTVGTVEHLYGKDSNTVLRDVMGAAPRAPDVEERLNALSRAIANEDHATTAQHMASLEADLGANDPELVTARWELHLQGVGEE